jgi:hypothetical protein
VDARGEGGWVQGVEGGWVQGVEGTRGSRRVGRRARGPEGQRARRSGGQRVRRLSLNLSFSQSVLSTVLLSSVDLIDIDIDRATLSQFCTYK